MQPTPENLRNRAAAAHIAGDDELANTLHAEADELEQTISSTGDAASQERPL